MKLIGVLICLMMVVQTVSLSEVKAAATDFNVRTFVGNDTTPPSAPAPVTAQPVALTQINITWGASTDDVQVSGYRLFRDAVQIATTTLLSFSDTGLTPSTTYSYYVDAFDTFNNISSSSVTVATTTFALPPPVATSSTSTPNQSGGGTRVLTLQNLQITPGETSALFYWQTNTQTQYSLSWGRTTAYELGSVSGTVFNQNHSTRIDMLEPGTVYYYKLSAIDGRGTVRVISSDTFTTLNKVFTNTIPNVEGFTAVTNGEDVQLSWRNTFTDPSMMVRIVRSHLFYPANIQDGSVVYEGRSESATDEEALGIRSPQYYTIFVMDPSGKVSSGAIARAYRVTDSTNPDIDPLPTEPGTDFTPPTAIDEGDPAILRAGDITIIQNGTTFTLNTTVTLDYELPFVIRIPVDAVAPHLKTITVSLQNPTNHRDVSAYLLKLNPEGDAYEAYISPTPVVGSARILVEVFDYEQETVRRISAQIEFVSTKPPVPLFPDQILNYMSGVMPWILLALLGCFLWLVFKRRRKDTTDGTQRA